MLLKPNTNCVQLGSLFYMYRHRKSWLLLYYHDFSKASLWKKTSDALNYSDPDMYSIMYYLSPDFMINKGYEFLLDYPEVKGQNIWFQKNNPLYEYKQENKMQVEGYKGISISWSGSQWGGLFRSNLSSNLFDGSYGASYGWFTFGRTSLYGDGVPGPEKVVNKTRLWVRVNNIANFSCHVIHCNLLNRFIGGIILLLCS